MISPQHGWGVRMRSPHLPSKEGKKISRFAAGEAAKVGFGGGDGCGKSCLWPTKKISACSSFWEQVMPLV